MAPPWKLKRSELRKIYNSYAMATEKEAAILTVPTEREKLWIPESLRLKRVDYVEIAKIVNAAFLETLVGTLIFIFFFFSLRCTMSVYKTLCARICTTSHVQWISLAFVRALTQPLFSTAHLYCFVCNLSRRSLFSNLVLSIHIRLFCLVGSVLFWPFVVFFFWRCSLALPYVLICPRASRPDQ